MLGLASETPHVEMHVHILLLVLLEEIVSSDSSELCTEYAVIALLPFPLSEALQSVLMFSHPLTLTEIRTRGGFVCRH